MGTLQVDNIKSTTIAENEASPITLSGNNANLTNSVTFPTGHILQVKTGTLTSNFNSTTSGAWLDTGLKVAITPSSTSSKVLIMLSCGISPGTGGHNIHLALLRGSTAIGDRDFGSTIDTFAFTNQGANSDVVTVGQHFVDSPSSVSEQTYKIQMSVSSGTGAIGRRADADSRGMGASLTAMEILG